MKKIKVGVAGYGTIGQRLADGVALQGDMELIGVADFAPTLAVRALYEKGMPYDLYLVDGADKSKFEILSATVDKPAYGAQLASMLELTTATISHHTSALLDQNLLTLDKVDTKVYYRANPDMIRALINFVKKELLHE